RRVVSGMNTNGTPQEIACTGRPETRADAGDDTAAAASAASAMGSPNTGSDCVIQAKLRLSPFQVSDTGVGPTPRPKTMASRVRSMTPVRASANVVPIVGW